MGSLSSTTSSSSFSSLLLTRSIKSKSSLLHSSLVFLNDHFVSSVSVSASVTSSSLSATTPRDTNTINCQEIEKEELEELVAVDTFTTMTTTTTTSPPFDDSMLSYDHYNGVTIHLDKYHHHHHQSIHTSTSTSTSTNTVQQQQLVEIFASKLQDGLQIWKAEGKKGIWIHTHTETAMYIPSCIESGFQFHKILPENDNNSNSSSSSLLSNKNNNLLVLSQWLPTDKKSKLPLGPTHQIGVGVVVLNPLNPLQMLVVQEKSGPAAAYDLWKMPTGLLDPNEHVHDGARRELQEETALNATVKSIVSIKQSHRGGGATSDMFFVCYMELDDSDNNNDNSDNGQQQPQKWKACEDEIADIQWMSVEAYCDQTHWKKSPLYVTLNDCVLQVSKNKQYQQQQHSYIEHYQRETGYGGTEALFIPKTIIAAPSVETATTAIHMKSLPSSSSSPPPDKHMNSSKL